MWDTLDSEQERMGDSMPIPGKRAPYRSVGRDSYSILRFLGAVLSTNFQDAAQDSLARSLNVFA